MERCLRLLAVARISVIFFGMVGELLGSLMMRWMWVMEEAWNAGVGVR